MPELQRLTATHASAVLAFELTNRAYFTAAVGDRGDAYFEDFDQRLASLFAEQESGSGAYYVLVEDDGAVVGRFNLVLDEDGLAELGYRIAERSAGRGLASATVRDLCDLAATRHDVHTVRAATTHDNVASQRVLANAGFDVVGPADPAEVGGGEGLRWERRVG